MTQTELLYKDPLAAAEQAAKEIAAKTGIAHHDVAL
jgi:purine-nucleoside phosphorylase